jgi:hypothetical protein
VRGSKNGLPAGCHHGIEALCYSLDVILLFGKGGAIWHRAANANAKRRSRTQGDKTNSIVEHDQHAI